MRDAGRNEDPDGPRHGAMTRAFHWATFVAVVVLYAAGILMTSEPLAHLADPLYITHKGLGTMVLGLVVIRIAWRLSHPAPEPPPGIPPAQRRMMTWGHAGLYALLLLMAVSGYVRTVADGFPIELLDRMGVPPLLPRSQGLAAAALVTHQVAAYTLAALVAAHMAAALDDAVISRRGLMRRMWPPWSE